MTWVDQVHTESKRQVIAIPKPSASLSGTLAKVRGGTFCEDRKGWGKSRQEPGHLSGRRHALQHPAQPDFPGGAGAEHTPAASVHAWQRVHTLLHLWPYWVGIQVCFWYMCFVNVCATLFQVKAYVQIIKIDIYLKELSNLFFLFCFFFHHEFTQLRDTRRAVTVLCSM